jgi:hypothetical protein
MIAWTVGFALHAPKVLSTDPLVRIEYLGLSVCAFAYIGSTFQSFWTHARVARRRSLLLLVSRAIGLVVLVVTISSFWLTWHEGWLPQEFGFGRAASRARSPSKEAYGLAIQLYDFLAVCLWAVMLFSVRALAVSSSLRSLKPVRTPYPLKLSWLGELEGLQIPHAPSAGIQTAAET